MSPRFIFTLYLCIQLPTTISSLVVFSTTQFKFFPLYVNKKGKKKLETVCRGQGVSVDSYVVTYLDTGSLE